jgi:hypothetical protein
MTVQMYGDVLDEADQAPLAASAELPSQTSMVPVAKKVHVVEMVECVPDDEVEVLPAREQDEDDELDEIIDRVIEVVKARRAGRPVPPRRHRHARRELEAEPALAGAELATKMNPNKKALIYAGVGIGVAALAGGLWWYFKKK